MSSLPRILVLSTFATDTLIEIASGKTTERPGGPAHFIKSNFERMGVPHNIVTGEGPVSVVMEVVDGECQPGKIYTNGSKIRVNGNVPKDSYDGTVINFLDDFDMDQVLQLEGVIELDIGPLTRGGEYRQSRVVAEIPSKEVRERISIIKASDEEYPAIPKEWALEQQEERIMLHTLGSEGCVLWDRGKRYNFAPPSVKPKSALGAGDTIGSAFLAHYLMNGGDAPGACEQAILELDKFFMQQ